MSEAGEMWKAHNRRAQRGRRMRERARFNAIRNAVREGRIRVVRRLGPHGVRLASLDRSRELDYWPGRGTLLEPGRPEGSPYRQSRSGVSVAQVLRELES